MIKNDVINKIVMIWNFNFKLFIIMQDLEIWFMFIFYIKNMFIF